MCIFCEILSGKRRELPWAGNEPVDKYKALSEWRASHAKAYRAFAGKDIDNRSSTAGVSRHPSGMKARRSHGQPTDRVAHGDKTG